MKTVETLTIPRTVLTKLVKRNRQLIYMNYFLVHLCAMRNIDLVFMADEVCRMLKITPEQLEAVRRFRSQVRLPCGRRRSAGGVARTENVPFERPVALTGRYKNIQGARMRSLYA